MTDPSKPEAGEVKRLDHSQAWGMAIKLKDTEHFEILNRYIAQSEANERQLTAASLLASELREQLASERAGREQAIADARRMHYLGNVIRARSQVEQDELTRLMRKYPPLAEVAAAPPSEAPHDGMGGGDDDGYDMSGIDGGPTHRDVRNWAMVSTLGPTFKRALVAYVDRCEQAERTPSEAQGGKRFGIDKTIARMLPVAEGEQGESDTCELCGYVVTEATPRGSLMVGGKIVCTQCAESPPASPPASDADGEPKPGSFGPVGNDPTRCNWVSGYGNRCIGKYAHAGAHWCGPGETKPASPPPSALGPVELMIAALRNTSSVINQEGQVGHDDHNHDLTSCCAMLMVRARGAEAQLSRATAEIAALKLTLAAAVALRAQVGTDAVYLDATPRFDAAMAKLKETADG